MGQLPPLDPELPLAQELDPSGRSVGPDLTLTPPNKLTKAMVPLPVSSVLENPHL